MPRPAERSTGDGRVAARHPYRALACASKSYQLYRLETRDPADRLLIAIELGCPLVTYDECILRFQQKHGRQHGFSASA
jgi:hypothetical protein